MKIIGLAGKSGAGKDTAAGAIEYLYPGRIFRYSFAMPLRAGIAAMLGADIEAQSRDRERKNDVIELYGVSPRYIMQTLGTDWGRAFINENVWVLRAKAIWDEQLRKNPDAIIVVSDVRYDNEAQAVLDCGGRVVEIVRPDNPHTQQIQTGGVVNHTSEAGINPELVSHTITNGFDSERDFINSIMYNDYIVNYLKGIS